MMGLRHLATSAFVVLATPTLAAANVVLLDQGWTEDERQTYYRTSQGSALMSYDIFLHLEEAGSERSFRADQNMARYGLVPQPADRRRNPDGLPIGWTRTVVKEGRWKGDWAGISCAACHNGQLEYRGTSIRIDGGFNHTLDLFAFLEGLDDALQAANKDPGKFARLQRRIPASNLRERLAANAAEVHAIRSRYLRTSSRVGPGRMDALNLVHNQVVANSLGYPENWMALNAPVKWPFLWNAPQSAWIGWRGTQQFPLSRNIGESMGLWVKANLTAKTPEEGLFDTTADMNGQIAMEGLLRRLAPPRWPEEVLGKIDRVKAAAGKALFRQECAQCHSQWPHRWGEPKRKGMRFIENALIPAKTIGTDPTQVQNLTYGLNPTVFSGALAPFLPPPHKGQSIAPALVVLVTAVSGVTEKALAKLGLSAEQTENVTGYRNETEPMPPNGLYKAAPSEGMWAIAPYLHNGSVPNLYELLIPAKDRSKRFYLGREFDPVKVGVDTSGASGKFLFDTTLVGNSNAGHSFEDGPISDGVIGRRLSDEERWAIIEYLKILPEEPRQITPFGGPKDPIAAWKDPTFYHVKHPGGYQAGPAGTE
ncbi:di-heme-cytochrome C peroxidase [Sorangium sp. So ce302]|uniref:di-heme-cytochrome C peroxidase n=1 Tax=Sorangium sp. So ce302 TaxID=3133297 RepID=UPI003F616251